MRTFLVAALLLTVAVLATAPAEARPISGGGCQLQEEYVTEASIGHAPSDPTSLPMVHPGANRPIECYY